MLEQCSESPTKFITVALRSNMHSYPLNYSPQARSVLGTSLDTAGDEPIAKNGRAKTDQPDCLLWAFSSMGY